MEPSSPEAADSTLPTWGQTCRLMAGVALVYALFMNPAPTSSMVLNNLHLAVSLVDRRSVELAGYRDVDVLVHQGRHYSGQPPGSALPAAALYGLLRPLFSSQDEGANVRALNVLSILLVGIPLAAIAVGLFFRMAALLAGDRRSAFLVACLVAFGTPLFGYSGGYYKKHVAAALAFIAFYLLFSERRGQRPHPAASLGSGLLGGFAGTVDYPWILFVPLLMAYRLTYPRPRQCLYLLLGAAVPAVFLMGYHGLAFGSPWVPFYAYTESYRASRGLAFSPGRLLRILAGHRAGLIPFVPLVLFLPRGLWVWWRDGRWRPEWFLVGVPAVGLPLLYSFYWAGDISGGEALAARQPVNIFPLAALAWVFSLPVCSRRGFWTLAGLSVLFAYLGAQAHAIPSDSYPLTYALKDLVLSLGSPELFDLYLPRWLGLETPLLLRRFPEAFEGVRLLKAFGVQAASTLVFSGALAAVFYGLRRLWAGLEGGPSGRPRANGSAVSR